MWWMLLSHLIHDEWNTIFMCDLLLISWHVWRICWLSIWGVKRRWLLLFLTGSKERTTAAEWMWRKELLRNSVFVWKSIKKKKKEDISMNHPHLTLWLLSSVMQTDSISDHCLYQLCPALFIPGQSRLDSAQHRLWPPSPGQPSQVSCPAAHLDCSDRLTSCAHSSRPGHKPK